jgi:hypothetical protein
LRRFGGHDSQYLELQYLLQRLKAPTPLPHVHFEKRNGLESVETADKSVNCNILSTIKPDNSPDPGLQVEHQLLRTYLPFPHDLFHKQCARESFLPEDIST